MKPTVQEKTLSEDYLQLACNHLPMVKQIIDTFGDMSLFEYIQTLIPKPGLTSYQSRKDLLEVVYNYIEPLLGKSIAQQTVKDLDTHPVVLTGNHHGVEFFSQTFQARLLLSLTALKQEPQSSTIPVFACGNIPLDNSAYPRGALIYDVTPEMFEALPIRLPVFPDRLKRRIVSAAPAFDHKMIKRASLKADQMIKDKKVSALISGPLQNLLRESYGNESVVHLPAYSHQSVVVNYLIWKQLFPQFNCVPNAIYLELEKIAGRLMEFDVLNPQSLLWVILFDPELRSHILAELDGINGCWNRKALDDHQSVTCPDKQRKMPLVKCGTVFFWGIDDSNRKLSLNIKTNDSNMPVFHGIDDRGNTWEWPYSPEAIKDGLAGGRLLPSVFFCFVVLLFARGLTCIGGYFQGEYLPAMKKGLVSSLKKIQKYETISKLVEQVRADCYLDGMLAVMTRISDNYLVPAGPLEIIAGGGITKPDIDKMANLTVRDAHLADMLDTIQDAVPVKTLSNGWKKNLSASIYQSLKHQVVIK